MIKEFNKTNLRDLRAEVAEALNLISMKYGVQLTLGNISYNSDELTCKLTGVIGESSVDAAKVIWDK
jgi:hypothetical protein